MSKQQKKQPNNGRNRQERRAQERRPHTTSSGKPLWLRILIVGIIFAMLAGFFLVPLLGR